MTFDNVLHLIIALIVLLIIGMGVFSAVKFRKEDIPKTFTRDNILAMIKSIVLTMIVEAEAEYGAKTGKLKQASVVQAIIDRYPTVLECINKGIIIVEEITNIIDEVVLEFNNMKKSNVALDNYIENKKES